MYKVRFAAQASSSLRKLSRTGKVVIKEIIEDLEEDPGSGKPLKRKHSKRYSYRVGTYRIIYQIRERDDVILVLKVDHRATVYN